MSQSDRRFVAIVNPAAGGGACGKQAPQVIGQLRSSGIEVEVRETRRAGDGQKLAREAYREGHRNFIAAGGDGTSFEVINGIFSPDGHGEVPEDPKGPEGRIRLGFLPMGTGNSFLRDFSDKGCDYAIESLLENRRRSCDLIRVDHRDGVLHFSNIFSIGFVADVGAMRNDRFARLGEFGYVVAVVAQVVGLAQNPMPMALDNGPQNRAPITFLSINNSRFTGGKMMMAPDANTADGLLDVVCVGALGRLSLLQTFPKIFKGTHVLHPAVTQAQGKVVTFELGTELDAMIDGEILRILPKRLEVVPGVFDICA